MPSCADTNMVKLRLRPPRPPPIPSWHVASNCAQDNITFHFMFLRSNRDIGVERKIWSSSLCNFFQITVAPLGPKFSPQFPTLTALNLYSTLVGSTRSTRTPGSTRTHNKTNSVAFSPQEIYTD
jgi:hypothetical protein